MHVLLAVGIHLGQDLVCSYIVCMCCVYAVVCYVLVYMFACVCAMHVLLAVGVPLGIIIIVSIIIYNHLQ